MNKFINIDSKLVDLATKLNAKLTKDRPEYPEALRTFQERRIDWIENNIHKAIIIQPTFEESGVNSHIWNLINIAWRTDDYLHEKKWLRYLIERQSFEIIEQNIDDLLSKSENDLIAIGNNDFT